MAHGSRAERSRDPLTYSSRPLPSARYLPGRSPHPDRASGREPSVAALDPDTWETCEDYLYAIDLFNQGYWWEAHEVFEEFWRAAGRGTPVGRFLQGLIQISAAFLKSAIGSTAAAEGLARSGCAKLRGSTAVSFGIDADRLAASVEAYFEHRSDAIPRIDLAL